MVERESENALTVMGLDMRALSVHVDMSKKIDGLIARVVLVRDTPETLNAMIAVDADRLRKHIRRYARIVMAITPIRIMYAINVKATRRSLVLNMKHVQTVEVSNTRNALNVKGQEARTRFQLVTGESLERLR